jgi:hypothetical protein
VRELTGERPLGLAALSAFFTFGALMSAMSALALAYPGSWVEPLWRLNPKARDAFTRMGPWAVVMVAVGAACAAAAAGL